MATPQNISEQHTILHTLLALLPAVGLSALLWAVYGVGDGAYVFFRDLNQNHSITTGFAKIVTNWGNPLFYAVYAAILGWALREKDPKLRKLPIVYLIVQLAICFLLVRILKIAIGKPRPGVEGLYIPMSFDSAHNALPSGHSAEIIGAILPLALWRKNLVITSFLALFAALVAGSRIYLGWHAADDVLFGVFVGAYAGTLTHCLWSRA